MSNIVDFREFAKRRREALRAELVFWDFWISYWDFWYGFMPNLEPSMARYTMDFGSSFPFAVLGKQWPRSA
jgi:hypothetical protein